MVALREAKFPDDTESIANLDISFTTDKIYAVSCDGDRIDLGVVALSAPITKRFPLDDLAKEDRPWELALVAIDDGRICGFIAAGYQDWNRRLTILHLYVDAPQRKRGIARLLLNRAEKYGRGRGALNMWLETSKLNLPGVRAYRRLGFKLCGVDTTLYEGTPAAGEAALFFARRIVD